MRLTLSRAKELFRNKAPAKDLEYRLNRVCERFILDGKFMGSMARLWLAAPYGQITLPRGFRTLEGASIYGSVFDIENRWFQFLPGRRDTRATPIRVIDDLDDGHAVMYTANLLPLLDGQTPPSVSTPLYDFPAGSGTIKATYSGANFTITIDGRDINEMPVTLTLSDQTAVANPFSRISRIHKEAEVQARIEYTAASPDNRVLLLALMEPTETETFYRRYYTPELQNQATTAVEAFCKRRHLEFTRDKDVLPFTNISALEKGLEAYNYEQENDQTLADQLWAKGISILNKELGDASGANEIPVIRFMYPGNTAPRLTSRY